VKKQYNNIVYIIAFLVCMAVGAFECTYGIRISSRALELFGFVQVFLGCILCAAWGCGLVRENELKKQEKLAELKKQAIESGDFSKLVSFKEEIFGSENDEEKKEAFIPSEALLKLDAFKSDEEDDEFIEPSEATIKNMPKVLTLLVATIILIFITVLSIGVSVPAGASAKVSIPAMAICLGQFFLYLLLEKWFFFKKDDLAGAPTFRRFLFLIQWTSLFIMAMFAFPLLNIFDSSTLLYVLITIEFIYLMVMIALELGIKYIRKDVTEDLNLYVEIPFFKDELGGRGGLIDYLETNTGMSLRSLWSIKYIKTLVPIAALVFCLGVWGSTCFVKIDTTQEGMLYRFGKASEETVLKPGLHIKFPWPIDKVTKYEVSRVQKLKIGYEDDRDGNYYWTVKHGLGEEYQLLLGGGKELVSVNMQISYRINDLYSYVVNYNNPVYELEAMAYELILMETVVSNLDTILSKDREAFIQNMLAELRDYSQEAGLGLEVLEVTLGNIHPPIDVADVYQNVVSAGHQKQALINLAQAEYNKKIPTAETEKTSIVSASLVKEAEKVSTAVSETATYNAQMEVYTTNKDFYKWRKYLEAYENGLKGKKLYVLEESSKINEENIFFGLTKN